MQSVIHVYEVRPRKAHRDVDLTSDALPFGRLWYDTPENAIGYAIHSSRSHDAVIRVYDESGNVIQTHEHWRFPNSCLTSIRAFPYGPSDLDECGLLGYPSGEFRPAVISRIGNRPGDYYENPYFGSDSLLAAILCPKRYLRD